LEEEELEEEEEEEEEEDWYSLDQVPTTLHLVKKTSFSMAEICSCQKR
jgi:hypothetical protein